MIMFEKHKIFIIFLFSFNFVSFSEGLKCYTCSVTENDSDTTCADDIEGHEDLITDCDKKYCTITRIEYLDPKGKLASLSRNCVDKVSSDGIVEDSTFRTYTRSCKTDLCNEGSGKSDSSENMRALGDKSMILIEGIQTSAANVYNNYVLLIITVFYILF